MTNKVLRSPLVPNISGSIEKTRLRNPVWLFTMIFVMILGCISLTSCQTENPLRGGLNENVTKIDRERVALQILAESLRYENEELSFTIPTSVQDGSEIQGEWEILITGRAETPELGGVSLHYLADEKWEAGKTYSIAISKSEWKNLTELWMEASVKEEEYVIDLLAKFQMNSIFKLKGKVLGLTFYRDSASSGGGVVGGEYIDDVARWLESFTVGEMLGETLPEDYNSSHVLIRYEDGTQEDRLLSVVQIEDFWYAVDNSNAPPGFLGYMNISLTDDPTIEELTFRLAERGIEEFRSLCIHSITPLLSKTVGERTLLLAEMESTPHIAGLNNLIMGIWDATEGEFVGETYTLRGDSAEHTSWYGQNGHLYVLWANSSIYQGFESSQGLQFFCFDGWEIAPVYELPACATYSGILPEGVENADLLKDEKFWFDRKASPVDRGIELYERNPNWNSATIGEEEQWIYKGYVPFEFSIEGLDLTSISFLVDYYKRSNNRVYFRGGEPEVPQECDLRIDTVRFLGREPTNETTGEAYLVKMSVFATRMEGTESQPVAQWWPVEQEYCVVLGRSMDGKLYEVRGQRNGVDDDIKNIILEESFGLGAQPLRR